ncbi:hypothetical protein [Spirillospora albida]|uniref:hypothetical protein n=1 Tax=Spirillospora albida TaxID=58123 RepID=UPI0004BE484E|nr:hypothetical protein [Spirillospora albida]
MGGSGAWRVAWSAALDALELDVVKVERLIAEGHQLTDTPVADPWAPPEGLGPLPLDLRPRADAILTRQLAAAQALAIALTANRRQAAVAGRFVGNGDDGGPRPAYVDCAA